MAFLSDSSCKQIFTYPEMAKELLCAAVARRWARALPLTAFELVNASYVTETGKQRHDDLVWRIRRAKKDDLFLLVEFQSRPDQLMAERMHAYTALLSETLAKQGRAEGVQILPIVVYTGSLRWPVKTATSTLHVGQPGLESLESQFSYHLVGIDTIQDGSNIVHLLLALNQARHPEELRTLLEELNLWRGRQSNQSLAQAIDTLVELKVRSETECPALAPESTLGEVIEMFDQQSQCFIEYFKREHGREERIKGMWAGRKHGRRLAREAGRQEGRQEGREEGREQGREEGREEGRMKGREEGREEGLAAGCQRTCLEMVRQILELRKVQLSKTATDRLAHADLPQLKTWLAQLLSNELPAELQN